MIKPLTIYCAGHAGWRAAHYGGWGLLPEGVTLLSMNKSVRKTVENIKAADFVWANLTYGDDEFELADVAIATRLGRATFLTLPEGLNADGMNLPKVDHIIRTGDSEADFKALLKVIEEWRANTDSHEEANIADDEDAEAYLAELEAKLANDKAKVMTSIARLFMVLVAKTAEIEAKTAEAEAAIAEARANIANAGEAVIAAE